MIIDYKMEKIKFKKLHPDAKVPVQSSLGAANFDFVCTEIEVIGERQAIIRFGLAMEFPKKYKLIIVPRSGITHKGWVMANSPGQVDSDYRGELQMRIEAIPTTLVMGSFFSYPPIPFKVGDRAAQGYLEEVILVNFEEVEELSNTERGAGGFGSTGK